MPPAALLDLLAAAARRALMLGHVHPDGDVLGTLLGARAGPGERAGWTVTLRRARTRCPDVARLPARASSAGRCGRDAPRTFDVVVLTDCPNDGRTEGLLAGRARRRTAAVLNIDHHPDNRRYGT